jgi:hypothetical protein
MDWLERGSGHAAWPAACTPHHLIHRQKNIHLSQICRTEEAGSLQRSILHDRSRLGTAIEHDMGVTQSMSASVVLLALCLCTTASLAASAMRPAGAAAALDPTNVAKVPVDLFVMSKCP